MKKYSLFLLFILVGFAITACSTQQPIVKAVRTQAEKIKTFNLYEDNRVVVTFINGSQKK